MFKKPYVPETPPILTKYTKMFPPSIGVQKKTKGWRYVIYPLIFTLVSGFFIGGIIGGIIILL